METVPAGISQTPKQIHEYKRIVFDFRGTPIVNLIENEPDCKPPRKQINGPYKNVSQEIFKPILNPHTESGRGNATLFKIRSLINKEKRAN